MLLRFIGITAATLLSSICVEAAYSTSKPNVFYYWGQNSAGGGSTQSSLSYYCQSGQADAVILSFLNVFNVGGLPGMNLAGACQTTFPGLQLLSCPSVGDDIRTCQGLGVKVILSLGGAAGAYSLSGDSDAAMFATTLWNLFGGGGSSTRPFGDTVIDGIDLDIEGGPSTGYAALVTAAKAKFGSGFIVGAAPQCPFPDVILGSVINAVAFDYVNVQFYNNYCSAASGSFNFATWANWASSTSPNKNVKVMLTLPGSSTAAGSGYIPMSTISTIVPQLASQYSSYGGVSIWDASQAWNNGNFASSLYSLVKGNSGTGSPPITTTTSNPATTTSYGTTPTTGLPPPGPPSGSPGSCVSNGQTCSSQGQFVCTSGGAYAVCDHSVWSVTSCPSNTVCIATADGTSIYCGYASSGSNTCSAILAVSRLRQILGGAVPQAYKGSQVGAQLTVVSSTADEFEAVINARRTVASPFSNQVTIEFTAPANVKISSVSQGTVRQVGTSVRIQANNTYNTSMAIVVGIKGTINSGIFVAPNPASLRFK
ncbi:hypothetical protein INT47_010175 [Mucor saturninus]|uniref:chitinase n=1 Tax=Mucor saturninus TaxID=64648 RepID=A0A8H7VBM5_9FUNG|nr:hypothetical protein INT47_010175 [Mucor saturninus]